MVILLGGRFEFFLPCRAVASLGGPSGLCWKLFSFRIKNDSYLTPAGRGVKKKMDKHFIFFLF